MKVKKKKKTVLQWYSVYVLLAGSRVHCSSLRKLNLSLVALFGDVHTLVLRHSHDSCPVQWAKRIGSGFCSLLTDGYVPGYRVPCGCGPQSYSPICSSGSMNGNADERGRTLWDCILQTPAKICNNIKYHAFDYCNSPAWILT